MQVTDWINRVFRRGTNVINPHYAMYAGNYLLSKEEYGKVIFVSICELLTNLINDVTFICKSGLRYDFASFNAFVTTQGELLLNRLFIDGYVVVGASDAGLKILASDEYQKIGDVRVTKAVAINRDKYKECYVVRSAIYELMGCSDYMFVYPYIKYLNNALNASNTNLERLGALIVASPKSPSNLPTISTLTKDQKDALEKEIETEYGSLSKQKQVMVLPREMDFQTISLATLDVKTNDRVRMAILAICDRLKVPANQVAIIDANSSKSLSNGSELREGDFNKYQSFERLLNRTFVKMAEDMGLKVDYTIYNKPERSVTNI